MIKEILVNSEPFPWEEGLTVSQVIERKRYIFKLLVVKIDDEVIRIIREQHQKALKILKDNEKKLHEIAEYLLERETITGEEFMEIFRREPAV